MEGNKFVTKEIGHTFVHANTIYFSSIDVFLYNRQIEEKMVKIIINEGNAGNVSDHYSLTATFLLDFTKSQSQAQLLM